MALLEAGQRVADCDSHVTESPDLWTSRVPKALVDKVPRVDPHPVTGVDKWHVGDIWMHPVAGTTHAGWTEYAPSFPTRWEDIDPGGYDPVVRLQRLDEMGVYAQTLYPNIMAFCTGAFVGMQPDVGLACVRAYNDFLTEFASADPRRLIPIAMVPFWDLEASVTEIERVAALGHRGILFANQFQRLGLPPFQDEHWDPIYNAAQSLGLPVNYHAGFANSPLPKDDKGDYDTFGKWQGDIGMLAANVATAMINSNSTAFGTICLSGLAERFPRAKFVSIESGMGYVPYLLDSLDWHYAGYGVHETGRRRPSDIFREQCYGAFWFETSTLGLLEQYPDNFLFSTDYPHPTALVAGPASPSLPAREHIETHFAAVPDAVRRKALWDNAAGLYGLEP